MKLHALLESQGAGAAVAQAATKRGHTIADSVAAADVVYARTCTFDPWRTRALDLLTEARALDKPSLPGPLAILLYDDKVAQVAHLGPWLPHTVVIRDAEAAEDALGGMHLPFISKAAVGAASQNVRLVRTKEEARAEIVAAFRDGIPLARGSKRSPKPITRQIGYLLWQEFIHADFDVRVVINGPYAYGLRRWVRSADQPFASGSGKRDVIVSLEDDASAVRAFHAADQISKALGLRWACYDFVQTASRTFVLEVSFSWVEKAYAECPLFDRGTLKKTGATAAGWASIAVEEMERLVR